MSRPERDSAVLELAKWGSLNEYKAGANSSTSHVGQVATSCFLHAVSS